MVELHDIKTLNSTIFNLKNKKKNFYYMRISLMKVLKIIITSYCLKPIENYVKGSSVKYEN